MKELQDAIKYQFKDKKILMQALTHSSFANESHGAEKVQSNERLEFLGDAVVSIVTATYLFFKFPDMQEGELTKLKASLICTSALSDYAKQIDLGQKIIFGKSAVKGEAWNNASMLENTFEALTGAVYLDGGFDEAEKFVLKFIAPAVENHIVSFRDYKSELQEAVQRDKGVTVKYVIIGESGPDHNKVFTARALQDDKIIGTGEGKSKKGAEQNAAQNAMKLLGYLA